MQKIIKRQANLLRLAALGESEAEIILRQIWGEDREWLVLHQLRIPTAGGVVEFDHLLVSRLMDIWVLHDVSAPEGLEIDAAGGFSLRRGALNVPMPSPILAMERQVEALKALYADGRLLLPQHYGRGVTPRIHGLVLLASRTPLHGDWQDAPGGDSLVRVSALSERIMAYQAALTIGNLVRLVSMPVLSSTAQDLVALHQPETVDWAAELGVPGTEAGNVISLSFPVRSDDGAPEARAPIRSAVMTLAEVVSLPQGASRCAACGKLISRRDRLRLGAGSGTGSPVLCTVCAAAESHGAA